MMMEKHFSGTIDEHLYNSDKNEEAAEENTLVISCNVS